MVRTIAPEALAERLLNGDDDDVLVLDLRSRQEWDASGFHIPGALRLPDQELTCLGLSTPRLPADELVVLYGDARDALDVRACATRLSAHGLRVACLVGGLNGWVRRGFPLEWHRARMSAQVDAAPQSA